MANNDKEKNVYCNENQVDFFKYIFSSNNGKIKLGNYFKVLKFYQRVFFLTRLVITNCDLINIQDSFFISKKYDGCGLKRRWSNCLILFSLLKHYKKRLW